MRHGISFPTPKHTLSINITGLILPPRQGRQAMKSSVIKRSIVIDHHNTSVSLEDEFWKGLREIAEGRKESVQHLISNIDKDRDFANLSSAIRLFVLHHYRDQFHQLPKTSLHHPEDLSIVPRD